MESLLSKINSSQDVKKLNYKELDLLAQDIREEIIDTVSKTGGHLGSSLGVVEITLALHKYLDLPKDKIVFDVGHQCYAHKLITGRKEQFHTLRQYNGLSGFPKPNESDCDSFIVGHASTSLSISAGFAAANRKLNKDEKIACVIGDGALTGGMCYEALNQIADLKLPIVVILNDNEMSISKNVGAISEHLAFLRTNPHYQNQKEWLKDFKDKHPSFRPFYKWLNRAKDATKYFFSHPQSVLFEEMGFTYLGPVDGHDIQTLTAVLDRAFSLNRPVIIHAITKKGRGYAPAIENPSAYHGVSPFNVETGKAKKPKVSKSYTEYFSDEIMELAKNDDKICAITAAMTSGTGLTDFAKTYPDRFYDVGIAEEHAITFGSAMAKAGMKPVAVIYSSFLQRSYDQLIHDVCLPETNLTICVDRAGLVGDDGETHQGVFDIAMLRQMPNMTVMAPSDGNTLKQMVKLAIDTKGPAAVRYHRGAVNEFLDASFNIPPVEFGKGVRLLGGDKLCILAVGNMVQLALKVAKTLSQRGITTAVYDLRFIKPLDTELLDEVSSRFDKVVTIEEGIIAGGVGSACLEYWEAQGKLMDVMLCGIPDKFIHQGAVPILLDEIGLSEEKMLKFIEARWGKLFK